MPPMPVYFVGKGSQFGVFDKLFDGTDRKIYDDTIANLDTHTLIELTRTRRTRSGARSSRTRMLRPSACNSMSASTLVT